MANHFRQTAEVLRQMAASRQPGALTTDEREAIQNAAQTLCRLEQLKRDLIATDPEDEGQSNHLCAEFMSLLGLHAGS